SPEQCQGQPLDGRSDLYSLGIVLYEAATGYLPFEAKTLSAAIHKHVYIAPPPPRQQRPDLSPQLESIILRCLEKDPNDRFASAQELCMALGGLPGTRQVAADERRTIVHRPDAGEMDAKNRSEYAEMDAKNRSEYADVDAPTVEAADRSGTGKKMRATLT